MRNMMVAMVGVAMLAGCKQAPSGQAPVTEAEAGKIAAAAEATFTAGDLGQIMDQYADNAVMIDASKPDPSADRKVATDSARNFVSMKPGDYHVVGRHIQLVGPDAFVSSGVEQFTVAAGTARPTVSARFTDVFQRQEGKWKIVHEHVSMPPTVAGKA
ncbi:MAG: nuclear transport factor 2 family protein [Sphingomicrobium sp.]